MPDVDAAKLSSVKTYVLIAFIFEILAAVSYSIGALFYLGILLAVGRTTSGATGGVFVTAIFGGFGVFFLIAAILSVLVVIRTNKMRGGANTGDIAKLKALNSVGWAVVALIFSGVISGIMLLIANGPINELTTSTRLSRADAFDSITKLKALLDSGAITQDEFDAQKKKVLEENLQN